MYLNNNQEQTTENTRLVTEEEDDELAADWELMTDEEKRETITKAHVAFGADLTKLLTEAIAESWSRSTRSHQRRFLESFYNHF